MASVSPSVALNQAEVVFDQPFDSTPSITESSTSGNDQVTLFCVTTCASYNSDRKHFANANAFSTNDPMVAF